MTSPRVVLYGIGRLFLVCCLLALVSCGSARKKGNSCTKSEECGNGTCVNGQCMVLSPGSDATDTQVAQTIVWNVAFSPRLNPSACSNQTVTWSSQSFKVVGTNSVDAVWSPGNANALKVEGLLTDSQFTAVLSCAQNPGGNQSGTIKADWSGDHFSGTFIFGNSQGGVLVFPDESGTVTIQGIVVDATDHTPIGGAVVSMSLDAVSKATTDKFGLFYLKTTAQSPNSEPYTITVSAPQHQTLQGELNWGDRPYSQEFQLQPGETTFSMQVVASFANPGSQSLHGLAFDGTDLWLAGYGEGKIHKVDTSGKLLTSIDAQSSNPTGLTFDGTYLWVASDTTLKIYQIDTSGNLISSFAAPGDDSTGLAFDGTALWNADFSFGGRIHKLDTSGALITSFKAPGSNPEGLTFDGSNLWLTDYDQNKIYKLTTGGAVLASAPGPGGHPIGLTFDGTYLWLADQQTNLVYKLATSD